MALYVDIEKKLGDFPLKAKFEAGAETFAILGASGCGKSMTLKCIAGIETPDKGRIVLDGRVLFDSKEHINMPVRKRNVGYLFQDYALFPNVTVRKNILSGMKEKGRRKEEAVREYIRRFYLEGLENLYPWQLSGGQKQRAALARMLAAEPDIIMLDEPFSALDSYLKWQLEQEILKVMETYQKTVLFVSHDRNEVYRLTDKIAVMEQGKLLDVQEKKQLFDSPKTLAAALLTGCKNITRLKRESGGRYWAVDWGIWLGLEEGKEPPKYAAVRAHFFEWVSKPEPEAVFDCQVERVIEDTFSMILLFRQKGNQEEGDWTHLRYELPKAGYQKMKEQGAGVSSGEGEKALYLKIPREKLMLLWQ